MQQKRYYCIMRNVKKPAYEHNNSWYKHASLGKLFYLAIHFLSLIVSSICLFLWTQPCLINGRIRGNLHYVLHYQETFTIVRQIGNTHTYIYIYNSKLINGVLWLKLFCCKISCMWSYVAVIFRLSFLLLIN